MNLGETKGLVPPVATTPASCMNWGATVRRLCAIPSRISKVQEVCTATSIYNMFGDKKKEEREEGKICDLYDPVGKKMI